MGIPIVLIPGQLTPYVPCKSSRAFRAPTPPAEQNAGMVRKMEHNNNSKSSLQKHGENFGDSKRTETHRPQRITISNEVEEDVQSVKFCLETNELIELARNIAKDVVHHEVSFSEAEWYLKGIFDVARRVKGPARLDLIKHLKGVAAIFAGVEKKEYTATNQLEEFIDELTEMEKQMK